MGQVRSRQVPRPFGAPLWLEGLCLAAFGGIIRMLAPASDPSSWIAFAAAVVAAQGVLLTLMDARIRALQLLAIGFLAVAAPLSAIRVYETAADCSLVSKELIRTSEAREVSLRTIPPPEFLCPNPLDPESLASGKRVHASLVQGTNRVYAQLIAERSETRRAAAIQAGVFTLTLALVLLHIVAFVNMFRHSGLA